MRDRREAAEGELRTAQLLKQKLLRHDQEDASKAIIDEEVDWYELERDVWLDPEARKEAARRAVEEAVQSSKAREVLLSFTADGKLETVMEKYDSTAPRRQAQVFFQAQTGSSISKKRDESRLKEVFDGVHESYCSSEQRARRQPRALDEEEEFPSLLAATDSDLFDPKQWADMRVLSVGPMSARLLVEGYRRFESLPQSLRFRGPLLIYADRARTDDPALDELYRNLYPEMLELEPFPAGQIVGVVDLQDVWPRETFQQRIAEKFHGEVTSNFALILRNPRRLLVPLAFNSSKQVSDIGLAVIGPSLGLLVKPPLRSQPLFAKKYENELFESEQYLRFAAMIACVSEENIGKAFIELRLKPSPFEAVLIRADKDFGRALKLGYEARKRLNIRAYPELGFPLWYFARRLGEQVSSIDQLSVDVFRLKSRSSILFQRPYLFLALAGGQARFQGSGEFTLASDRLVALTDFSCAEWEIIPQGGSVSALGTGDHLATVFAVFAD